MCVTAFPRCWEREWEAGINSHKMTFPQRNIKLGREKSDSWQSRLTSARDGDCETETGIPKRSSPPPLSFFSPLSLSPHIFQPFSFNSGLVLSSLKACPHTPSSSLCSLNRLPARCSPTKTHTNTHTHTERQQYSTLLWNTLTPRCSVWLHLRHQPYIRGK